MGLIDPCNEAATLVRPTLLVKAARHAARQYRARNLAHADAAAGPGKGEIHKLRETERNWEALRREGAPGYRPSIHVQVLGAYLAGAEAAARR